jgi:acyl carrier protein
VRLSGIDLKNGVTGKETSNSRDAGTIQQDGEREHVRPRGEHLGGGAALGNTAIESAIAAIWEEILRKSPIKLDDRFLDLGGDSLMAIQVLDRIEATFPVELPLAQLIRREATVRTIAGEVAKGLEDMLAKQSVGEVNGTTKGH